MLPDVRVSIKDGGLGVASTAGAGVHVKIGVASTPDRNKLLTLATPEKIAEKIGTGPLADALMDSMQMGSKTIYCVAVEGEVAGTKTAVTKTGTGAATNALTGNPNNNYHVILEILTAGALNVATYRCSLDGGDTFTKEKTIPSNGAVVFEGTGLTLTFTAAVQPEDSFKAGDKYEFKATAPRMSNNEVLAALNVIKNIPYSYEFIHVVGESEVSLWAALAAEADVMFNNLFTPIFFVCEARTKTEAETLDAYVEALVTARQSVSSYRLQVVAARAEVSALDGKVRDTNGAGIVAGIYSKAKVSKSIGEVKEFPLSSVVKLQPEGIEDHIQTLDEAGFVTFRQYVDLPGFYVTNARMFAAPTSDYQFAEVLRVANKACREVRQQALMYEHAEADPNGVEAFKAFVQVPLDRMASETVKEIMSGEVVIPEDQDILGTSTIKVKISIVPIPILRNIDIEQRMTNPFI